MNKRRWTFRIVFTGALVAASFFLFGSREPVHRGKSVTRWIEDWETEFSLKGGYYMERHRQEFDDAFKEMGPKAVPALLRILRNPDPLLRRVYWKVLPLAPVWLQTRIPRPAKLHERDPLMPEPVFSQLLPAILQTGHRSIPLIIEALKDPNEDVRVAALGALGFWASESSPALDASVAAALLIEALKDRSAAVRGAAAGALGPWASGSVGVVDAVARALDDEEGRARFSAIGAMHRVGSRNPAVISGLSRRLGDSDRWSTNGMVNNRNFAAKVLGGFGTEAKAAVPALQRLMTAEPWITNSPISFAHDAHFPGAGPYVEVWMEGARVEAANSIWRITSDPGLVLPFLIERLQSTRVTTFHARILDLLAEIGPPAKVAIPAIHKAVENIEPGSKPGLPHDESDIAGRAQKALERIK